MEQIIKTKVLRGREDDLTEQEQKDVLFNAKIGWFLTTSGVVYVWTLPIRECNRCHRLRYLTPLYKRCSNCHSVYYCSKECQRADWSVHKQECETVDRSEIQLIDQIAKSLANDLSMELFRLLPKVAERHDDYVIQTDLETLLIKIPPLRNYLDADQIRAYPPLSTFQQVKHWLYSWIPTFLTGERTNDDQYFQIAPIASLRCEDEDRLVITQRLKLEIVHGDTTYIRYFLFTLGGNGAIYFVSPRNAQNLLDAMGQKNRQEKHERKKEKKVRRHAFEKQ